MAHSPDSRPNRLEAPTAACRGRLPAALTTTSWSPRVELAVADWVRQGRWLGALGRGSGWWIGDWVRYGNARYGDRYGPAARATGYDLQSLMNMAYVAGRFEVSRRRCGLSFSHHAELASLPAEEQDLWLDRAESGALSVRSLRSELRRARRRVASRDRVRASRREAGAATRVKTSGGGAPTTSESEPEVVCPECGHHFAPPARRGASGTNVPGKEARPARLALAPPPEHHGDWRGGGLSAARLL
jgi:hypothetical protein